LWTRQWFAIVGWFWFVLTLVPVIGLLQVGQQSIADRYTYVPFVGLSIVVGWAAAGAVEKWPQARRIVVTGAGALLACYALLTVVQVRHWRDSGTLYAHVLSVMPDNYLANYNLIVFYIDTGNREAAVLQYLRWRGIDPTAPHAREAAMEFLVNAEAARRGVLPPPPRF
jgi:hypothetical protein